MTVFLLVSCCDLDHFGTPKVCVQGLRKESHRILDALPLLPGHLCSKYDALDFFLVFPPFSVFTVATEWPIIIMLLIHSEEEKLFKERNSHEQHKEFCSN